MVFFKMWFKIVAFVFPQIILIIEEFFAFPPPPWFYDEQDKKKDYINTAKPRSRHVGVSWLIMWFHFKMNYKYLFNIYLKG